MRHDLVPYSYMMALANYEAMQIRVMDMSRSRDLMLNTTHTMKDLELVDLQEIQKKIQKIIEN